MNMDKMYFLNVVDWLYSVSAQFGVNHVVIGGRIYWLDSKSDREELYKLWKESA